MNYRVGNNLLSRIMGAEVRPDPSGFDIGIRGIGDTVTSKSGCPQTATAHPRA